MSKKAAPKLVNLAKEYFRMHPKMGLIPLDVIKRNIFIQGKPKIGKSRLIQALHD